MRIVGDRHFAVEIRRDDVTAVLADDKVLWECGGGRNDRNSGRALHAVVCRRTDRRRAGADRRHYARFGNGRNARIIGGPCNRLILCLFRIDRSCQLERCCAQREVEILLADLNLHRVDVLADQAVNRAFGHVLCIVQNQNLAKVYP